ncbi:DUF4280 domain-containing protein [Apibacter muscae]|uniref:PAAR-like protein n=1 Tax=Apibacter muscae TaxID=2509004 RepID=UPI0011AC2DF1|nr:PAAR-like protein [Apibacter muscae]TWP30150.1 DUF4280 domain-containing protein [Apibacter muscae]
MSEVNKKYVPEGVFLVCDKGTMVTQLIADASRNVKIYGAKQCVDTDNKFGVNIIPFGGCATCGTCKFASIEWTKVKQGGVRVNKAIPLLEHSEGICSVGQGKIRIFFDEYEADLANENNNESAFVKESISSSILGEALTTPFGKLIDLFCEDNDKFTEGVGRGAKKGLESTWNFFTSDMWKADTWKGMGKLAVIGASYSSPLTGTLMGDRSLELLDSQFGTDFKQTKDALVEGVKKSAGNAWEDVKRGNMGEIGESVGQLEYAIAEALIGSKGAGLAVKGASTGAKALIGAERLAEIAATSAKWMGKLKTGALGLVKVGRMDWMGGKGFFSWGMDGATLRNQARLLKYPSPHYYDVLIHGYPYMFSPAKGELINASQLYTRLIEGGYKQGTPIRLISCSTGKELDGAAQQLANLTKSKVVAPTDLTAVDNSGIIHVANDGHFKIFYPE